jgi:hypothetical protein
MFSTTIQDSPLSQSSGTSALSNMMSERFILTSPIMRMEGVENTEIQQTKCYPPLAFDLREMAYSNNF